MGDQNKPMRQLVLADGLKMFSINAYETRFVHREVFGRQCYFRHGIALRDGDFVFDVGANIGLSAVFFHREGRHIRIYAFEPCPPVFECLKANMELHGVDARLFECGLSGSRGQSDFTFYPRNTVLSGFHSHSQAERTTLKTYMVNSGFPPQRADRLLGSLFEEVTLSCQLRTLSEIIDEEQVTRIDLLKIDTEKSEMEVLAGIRAEHWDLIRQVAIEVHAEKGGLEIAQQLLTAHGFQVASEQDPLARGTALFYVFASRPQ